MKKRMQKLMAALAVAATLGFSAGSAMAGTAPFNHAAKTVANSESYNEIISTSKTDTVQSWSVTLTSMSGLGTSGNPRYILTSARTAAEAQTSSSKLGLYQGMTGVQRKSYPGTVKQGQTYRLFGTGNNNAAKSYTITIKGRYTS